MDPWSRKEGDNLTSLAELNEANLLGAISKRYADEIIYTDVGDILVAVNPFRQIPIYTDEWSRIYGHSSDELHHLAPHIYVTSSRAFTALVHSKRDQVCVISGESGAGKTESTKLIIQQLMKICRSSRFGSQLQNKIIQLNPVVEAFGNAQTLLNNNSSRFGKYIQLVFTPQGRIIGAGLEQYLLEKSRVCSPGDKERNYHIFYYLYAGISPELAKKLKLENPALHRYLASYKSTTKDCTSEHSRNSYEHVLKSMKEIGFSDNEIEQVITLIASILHIGDIDFESSANDTAIVKNKRVAQTVTELLSLESVEDLTFALTTLRAVTRGETFDKQYSPAKAADVRDAMAKALYSRLFCWLIARINNYLSPSQSEGLHTLSIGILDIFGFENFQLNSFEQFCINLANEQLQQYFNTQIFAMEKEEYVKEGLEGVDITYTDNEPVLKLFLSQPLGLISLLDEQCKRSGSDDVLVQQYKSTFAKHASYVPNRGNALKFAVKHYAGNVEYQAQGFLDKNKDVLPDPVQGVLKFSRMQLVKVLFTKYPNFSGTKLQATTRTVRPSQRSVMRKMSVRKQKRSRRQPKLMTVSGHFRISLRQLMERLLSATPHFVRCIKPNILKKPGDFDSDYVLKQLQYTGMLEAIRVRKEGFAYRPFFSDFVKDYKSLAFNYTDKSVKLSRENCEKILSVVNITGWRIGKSRVFLRYFHEEKLNKHLQRCEDSAVLIQKIYRGYIERKRYRPLREVQQAQKLKVNDMLKAIKRQSEETFTRIVELNRIDVLTAIDRFGRPDRPPPEEESLPDEKRKFKPKAIGAVQVLVNIQPTDLILKKPNSSNIVTNVPVNKPVTNVPVNKAVTNKVINVPVNKPVTNVPVTNKVPVNKPVTNVPVNKPVTSVPVNKLVTNAVTNVPVNKPVTSVLIDTNVPANAERVSNVPVNEIATEVPVSKSTTGMPVNKSVTDIPVNTADVLMLEKKRKSSPIPAPKPSKEKIRLAKLSLTKQSSVDDDGYTLMNQFVVAGFQSMRDRMSCTSSDNDEMGKKFVDEEYIYPEFLCTDVKQDQRLSMCRTSDPSNSLNILGSTTDKDANNDNNHSKLIIKKPNNKGIDLEISAPLMHRISQLPLSEENNQPKLVKYAKKMPITTGFPPTISTGITTYNSVESIAGYLPGISDKEAVSLIKGTAIGTYLFYTSYSKFGNFIFKTAVSRGEYARPWLCDIYINQDGLYLTSSNSLITFQNLSRLASYYKVHSVNSDGLKLDTPCPIPSSSTSFDEMKFTKKKPVPLPKS